MENNLSLNTRMIVSSAATVSVLTVGAMMATPQQAYADELNDKALSTESSSKPDAAPQTKDEAAQQLAEAKENAQAAEVDKTIAEQAYQQAQAEADEANQKKDEAIAEADNRHTEAVAAFDEDIAEGEELLQQFDERLTEHKEQLDQAAANEESAQDTYDTAKSNRDTAETLYNLADASYDNASAFSDFLTDDDITSWDAYEARNGSGAATLLDDNVPNVTNAQRTAITQLDNAYTKAKESQTKANAAVKKVQDEQAVVDALTQEVDSLTTSISEASQAIQKANEEIEVLEWKEEMYNIEMFEAHGAALSFMRQELTNIQNVLLPQARAEKQQAEQQYAQAISDLAAANTRLESAKANVITYAQEAAPLQVTAEADKIAFNVLRTTLAVAAGAEKTLAETALGGAETVLDAAEDALDEAESDLQNAKYVHERLATSYQNGLRLRLRLGESFDHLKDVRDSVAEMDFNTWNTSGRPDFRNLSEGWGEEGVERIDNLYQAYVTAGIAFDKAEAADAKALKAQEEKNAADKAYADALAKQALAQWTYDNWKDEENLSVKQVGYSTNTIPQLGDNPTGPLFPLALISMAAAGYAGSRRKNKPE